MNRVSCVSMIIRSAWNFHARGTGTGLVVLVMLTRWALCLTVVSHPMHGQLHSNACALPLPLSINHHYKFSREIVVFLVHHATAFSMRRRSFVKIDTSHACFLDASHDCLSKLIPVMLGLLLDASQHDCL